MSSDDADPSFCDKLRAEEAALACSKIDEFEFLSIAGMGCNGVAFNVQHTNPDNPFAETKTYVIKTMMNYGGLTTRGLRSKYQKEFDHFIKLAATRKAMQAQGKRDGLVQFYNSFTGYAPDDMMELIIRKCGREFANDSFPVDKGMCVCARARVCACVRVRVCVWQ